MVALAVEGWLCHVLFNMHGHETTGRDYACRGVSMSRVV